MTRAVTLTLALALLGTSTLLASDRMKPGTWQFQMMADGRTSSSTMCITPEKAALANGDTKSARAAAEKASKGCIVKTYDIAGDTVTYAMECHGMLLESTITYHGDDYVGTLKATDKGEVHTTALKGHRLGSCDAKP